MKTIRLPFLLEFCSVIYERKCPYTFDQDTTTVSSLRKFNTRSCLITIFLLLAVVTLLALAGLIVAIYALTVNFNSRGIVFVTAATSSTTTVNTSGIFRVKPPLGKLDLLIEFQ